MNWKPTTDTTALAKALNKNNDSLIFDMFSDALLESNSPISMWDWLTVSCSCPDIQLSHNECGDGQREIIGDGTSQTITGNGQNGNFGDGLRYYYPTPSFRRINIPLVRRINIPLVRRIFPQLVRRIFPQLIGLITLILT